MLLNENQEQNYKHEKANCMLQKYPKDKEKSFPRSEDKDK